MIIKLVYSNKLEIEEDLKAYNLNNQTQIGLVDIERFLEEQLKSAYLLLSRFEDIESIQYTIQMILSFDNEDAMACFSVMNSTKFQHFFVISFRNVIVDYHTFLEGKAHLLERKNVFIHEFAHSLDFYMLNDFFGKINFYNTDNQHLFKLLNVFSSMRAEGIARIIDYIFQNRISSKKHWAFNSSIAITELEQYFLWLFDFKEKSINDSYKKIVYIYGKLMILNALYYFEVENKEKYLQFFKELNNGQNLNLEFLKDSNAISQMTEICIEEFIFVNIQSEFEIPFPFINHKRIVRWLLFSIQQEGYRSNKSVQIICNIITKETLTIEKIQEVLKDFDLKKEEIYLKYIEYINNDNHNATLKNLLSIVFNRWVKENNELDRYKLIYVFYDEYESHQALPILGALDNMLILSQ